MSRPHSVQRVDAVEKAEGRTRYLADLEVPGLLHARLLRSTRPHALLRRVEPPPLPPGYFLFDHSHVPGRNAVPLIRDDWPAFAAGRVDYAGEVILLLAGPDREELLRLRDAVRVDYEDLPPGAGAPSPYAEHTLVKGDPDLAFARAARVFEEELGTGFQEHLYLEPQSMLAGWEEGRVVLRGSLQCPFYVRHAAAAVLGVPEEEVRVVQSPTGGGFGGKEDYPEIIGSALAVAAWHLHRPVRLVLDREEDLAFTTKRHPAVLRYRTALDGEGEILGMEIDLTLDGGAHESYSAVVLQRALFTATGVYDLPNVRVRGRACVSHLPPAGAFRGFGAPQAIFGIETHLLHLARELGREPVQFKRRHWLRRGSATVTGGAIHEEVALERMLARAELLSGWREKTRRGRREGGREGRGRGIGLSFFLHGCGFTGDGEQKIIRARAGLRRLADGRVEILAAGAEMGQGLATAFRRIVADELGLPPAEVLYPEPDTARVPDSGPTVASRSTMIVGRLLQEAARELRERRKEPGEIRVEKHYVPPAWQHWDQAAFRGEAYPAYGWGVNVVEVEVDPVTAEVRLLGTWAVYDVGRAVDRRLLEGQAAGGMAQGLGWAGLERLTVREGRFEQRSLADYPVPTSLDLPRLEVDFVDNPSDSGPSGAKGAGELMIDGAAPAYLAAVEQATGLRFSSLPLTPETILAAGWGGPRA